MIGGRRAHSVSTRVAAMRIRRIHVRGPPRVLVVGGGPVGLTMGYLLDRVYGIPTRIIERQATPTTHPQAHFLNLRTMEVLHATMEPFHNRLLDQAAPSELWRDYIYTTGIGRAREFARIDQFGPNIPRPLHSKQELLAALDGLSPTQFLHFPQNRFETLLSTFVEDAGLHVERQIELVELHRRVRDGPTDVKLRCLQTQRTEDASFDFVIGADGAHSLVRQLSAIDMVGSRNLQSIVNVHFTSHALSHAARENPAMLNFVFNENVIGVLIAHDLSRGEWVIQIPFFPPQETIDQDFSVDQCKALVRHMLPQSDDGSPSDSDDISILSVGQWQMSARVATQYDVDRRVFLVGDAAHQFPPAGGLGMNTGLQDAHNLAWKLAWALQNEKKEKLPVDSATLLRSYERERQLVAKLNTQLSLRNVERTMKIPSALNVSHNNAKLLASVVNSAPVKLLPLSLQREAIQRIMALGKKPLGLLDRRASALGERMKRHVQEIVGRRASLGMLFYHFDIGFSYDTARWAKRAKELMQDDVLNDSAAFTVSETADDVVYTPQFALGVRFPHLWCVSDSETTRVSTVALERFVREHKKGDHDVRFVLVVDDHQWRDEETHDGDTEDVWRHVAVVAISNDRPTESTTDLIRLCVDDSSPSSVARWTQFTASHSAALVRPDGHVAFLFARGTAITTATLRNAMQFD